MLRKVSVEPGVPRDTSCGPLNYSSFLLPFDRLKSGVSIFLSPIKVELGGSHRSRKSPLS